MLHQFTFWFYLKDPNLNNITRKNSLHFLLGFLEVNLYRKPSPRNIFVKSVFDIFRQSARDMAFLEFSLKTTKNKLYKFHRVVYQKFGLDLVVEDMIVLFKIPLHNY
jgi:hypothetical protein